MVSTGWTKCKWCRREQRTSAKLGNRIVCRFCNRSFEVKIKLKKRPGSIPMTLNYTRADKLTKV